VIQMQPNKLKRALQEGQPTVGGWCGFDHVGVATLMAESGYDWILFDMEHGDFSLLSLRSCLDAVQNSPATPLVRVPANDPAIIKRVLDLGAFGLIIPMINTAQDALAAVRACKYPPQGNRGVGAMRASKYGRHFKDYLKWANDNILVVVQIEQEEALANIDAIAQISGIDCLFVGPADLSFSLGVAMDFGHPKMQNALDKVSQVGNQYGIPTGMWCADTDFAAAVVGRGMRLIALGADAGLLADATDRQLKRFKKTLGRK